MSAPTSTPTTGTLQRVLDAVHPWPRATTEIVVATGLDRDDVRAALDQLRDAGLVLWAEATDRDLARRARERQRQEALAHRRATAAQLRARRVPLEQIAQELGVGLPQVKRDLADAAAGEPAPTPAHHDPDTWQLARAATRHRRRT